MRLLWKSITVVLQVLWFFSIAEAFALVKPSALSRQVVGWQQQQGPRVISPVCASQDKETTGDKEETDAGDNLHPETPSKKKVSTSRAGGRSRQRERPAKNSSSSPLLANRAKIALPVVLVLWILSQVFQSSVRPPSYVFYQSSMYESRTLGADGRMETTRKESVKSNLPSLLQQDDERRLVKPSLLPDRDFDREIDREIDREMNEIDREMKSMMRFQQSLLDDFF